MLWYTCRCNRYRWICINNVEVVYSCFTVYRHVPWQTYTHRISCGMILLYMYGLLMSAGWWIQACVSASWAQWMHVIIEGAGAADPVVSWMDGCWKSCKCMYLCRCHMKMGVCTATGLHQYVCAAGEWCMWWICSISTTYGCSVTLWMWISGCQWCVSWCSQRSEITSDFRLKLELHYKLGVFITWW
jgi:hypothetical protein